MHGSRFPFAICAGFALLGVVLIIIGPADARVLGTTDELDYLRLADGDGLR